MSSLLADLVLVIHTLWVGVIVLSVPLILIGAKLDWIWIRNLWYRRIHLAMMGVVALESLFAIVCPLTELENFLRNTGQYEQSFIAHWLGKVIFYDFAPWIFTIAYLAVLALIVAMYIWIPPKSPARISELSDARR